MKLLILAVSCLLTACGMSETTPHRIEAGTVSDSAAIFQNRAYEEMFNGSLAKAEAYAYRAYLLSRDTTLECNALSLLCYIYYREGKQEELLDDGRSFLFNVNNAHYLANLHVFCLNTKHYLYLCTHITNNYLFK